MERHFTTYSGSDVRQQNQATIDSAKGLIRRTVLPINYLKREKPRKMARSVIEERVFFTPSPRATFVESEF
jgi:hypothetical protein